MLDGTPLAPVLIDMRGMALLWPSGGRSRFHEIAIPAAIREKRSRRAYQLWRETREKGFRMPVDEGLAEKNSAYLYRTTSLSLPQCERMGTVMASYLCEVIL